MVKSYRTPTGKELQGVLTSFTGVSVAFGPDSDGQPEWQGETDVWWEESHDVERDDGTGQMRRVWVDEDGEEWLESQLLLVEQDEVAA